MGGYVCKYDQYCSISVVYDQNYKLKRLFKHITQSLEGHMAHSVLPISGSLRLAEALACTSLSCITDRLTK